MTTRREALKGVAMLAAIDKITDGGFAPVSAPLKPHRQTRVLPPGATRHFLTQCVGCGLCVSACPEGVIRLSSDPRHFGRPELDFETGNCLLGCVRCTQVCPSDALKYLQREMRPRVKMGLAKFSRPRCIRVTDKEDCHACERRCPVHAITLKNGTPMIDEEKCIGCGACEHSCPARPDAAITVEGRDLTTRLYESVALGASLVVARDGEIVATEEGRGLKPLVKLYDTGILEGAVVVDKIVGRAAAAIYALAKTKKVFTPVAAKGACELAAKAGVEIEAKEIVSSIRNRTNTGDCPMEQAVRGLDDPAKMLLQIRTTLERMNKQ